MDYGDSWAVSEAKDRPTPQGRLHLHYIMRGRKAWWVVRTRTSHLCGTPRCRLVNIRLRYDPSKAVSQA